MINPYVYILVMALVTFIIRVTPLTLIRKEIKNNFLKSFLYYIPYVTLSLMTFPAIIYSTQSIYSGILALAVGLVVAYFKGDLFKVSLSCCAVVFILEFIII